MQNHLKFISQIKSTSNQSQNRFAPLALKVSTTSSLELMAAESLDKLARCGSE
jgi:hypothetical protein